MRNFLLLACVPAVALAGCQMTQTGQMAAGGLIGAGATALTAQALGANTNWTILAALGGAAIGTLVARNSFTGQCAFANGDGTYTTGPCPR
jgi:hypothetical protein